MLCEQLCGPHLTAVEAEATTKGATDGGKSKRAISKRFTHLQEASCFAEPVLATLGLGALLREASNHCTVLLGYVSLVTWAGIAAKASVAMLFI